MRNWIQNSLPGSLSSARANSSTEKISPPMNIEVKGMEAVIATVTGYRGSERFKLIRLIASTGAAYVGRMNQSVTHLVCWRHEGRKYEIAKRFNIVIVNHGWIEECVRQGTIVCEEPYCLQSGDEIAPLRADVKLWINQEKAQPSASMKSKNRVIDVESEDNDDATFNDSIQFHDLKEESDSYPTNFRRLRKRYTASSESREKPRSLENKFSNLDNWLLSSKRREQGKKIKASTKRNNNVFGSTGLDVEGCQDANKRRRFHSGDASDDLTDAEQILEVNNISEDVCNNTPVHDNISPASCQLSCVICWTDFSSTRGVLPCGHRFCYSCIKSWSDHMVSRNKPSTCPLCKASFLFITRVESAVNSDQKIYSQSMPDDISNVVEVRPEQIYGSFDNASTAVCFRCSSREPEDLLVNCNCCQIRCVHSFCLDPPLFPWICAQCKRIQMLYRHNL